MKNFDTVSINLHAFGCHEYSFNMFQQTFYARLSVCYINFVDTLTERTKAWGCMKFCI